MQIIDIDVVIVGKWDMTDQPLHDIADDLFVCGEYLIGAVADIDKSKLLTAAAVIADVNSKLAKMQRLIREKALRDEGEKII